MLPNRDNVDEQTDKDLDEAFYVAETPSNAEEPQPINIIGRFVESIPFQIFIILCIIFNTIFLAMDRYHISKRELYAIELANLIFF
jgi:hypothetical protein